MITKIKTFIKPQLKTNLPDIHPGDTIKVYQKIKEILKKSKTKPSEKKERIQIFEGLVIARKHGKEIGATITVRKVISGIGVEKIFPLHSSNIEKIKIVKRGKVRRAKLYYMRNIKEKKARLKQIEIPRSDKVSKKTETKKVVSKVKNNNKLENPITENKNEKLATKDVK